MEASAETGAGATRQCWRSSDGGGRSKPRQPAAWSGAHRDATVSSRTVGPCEPCARLIRLLGQVNPAGTGFARAAGGIPSQDRCELYDVHTPAGAFLMPFHLSDGRAGDLHGEEICNGLVAWGPGSVGHREVVSSAEAGVTRRAVFLVGAGKGRRKSCCWSRGNGAQRRPRRGRER